MEGVDRAQRWQIGPPRSGVADAGEIGVEVQQGSLLRSVRRL